MMIYTLSAILAVLCAFFFDMNSAGSSYGISSSQRSRILSQHAAARRKAYYGQTKLPSAKPTVRSSSINLAWSSSLASSAQRWANTCTFGHSSSGNGENIYWSSGTPNSGSATAATPNWLSELSYYTYSTGSGTCQSGKMCGHYTQAIWANTKRIGCAVSNCASSPVRGKYKTMVVCQYSPPGNYIGQYPYQRGDAVPFGEINIDPQQPAQQPLIGLNIIVFALVAMMIINITCLIATASKRCSKDGNFVSYQSVQTKEIEV